MIGVLLGGLNAANSITCHIISGVGYLGFLDKHYFQIIGCLFQAKESRNALSAWAWAELAGEVPEAIKDVENKEFHGVLSSQMLERTQQL